MNGEDECSHGRGIAALKGIANSTQAVLARYNADGSIDSTFGTSGVVTTDVAAGASEEWIGVAHTWDGKLVVSGYAGGDVAAARYNAGIGLDQRVWVQQDANFNVTSIANDAGEIVERYRYTPYGERTVLNDDFTADADGVSDYGFDLGHQGLKEDAETGLVYNRARYVQSVLGRFPARDVLEYTAGMSLYSYENERPTSLTDPSGKAPLTGVDPYSAAKRSLARKLNAIAEQTGRIERLLASIRSACAGPRSVHDGDWQWYEQLRGSAAGAGAQGFGKNQSPSVDDWVQYVGIFFDTAGFAIGALGVTGLAATAADVGAVGANTAGVGTGVNGGNLASAGANALAIAIWVGTKFTDSAWAGPASALASAAANVGAMAYEGHTSFEAEREARQMKDKVCCALEAKMLDLIAELRSQVREAVEDEHQLRMRMLRDGVS